MRRVTAEAIHSVKCELAAEVLRTSGALRLRVTGSSMLPSIWPGDVLIIKRREMNQVKAGDTAFFSCYGRLVAHRVISHHGSYFIAQGDSVPTPDPPVGEAQLLGAIETIFRRGKRLSPPSRVSFAGKMTAAVVRRSDIAALLLQRMHAATQEREH